MCWTTGNEHFKVGVSVLLLEQSRFGVLGCTAGNGSIPAVFQQHQPMVFLGRWGEGGARWGQGRIGLGRGGECGSLCCQILYSLPRQAAQHGPPQLCTCSNMGAEQRRPIAAYFSLPRANAAFPQGNRPWYPGIQRIQPSPFWHCWTVLDCGCWAVQDCAAITTAFA